MPQGNKILILRLSSLGDVVLATSVLEASSRFKKIDWVVASDFSAILREHPKINRLWVFDRFQGLVAWTTFCKQLFNENYDTVFDLHVSIRTRILKFLFYFWSFTLNKKPPAWQSISKSYYRYYGYFIFKSLWPKFLRPISMRKKFLLKLGATGNELPNLTHLVIRENNLSQLLANLPKEYFCIMPSSHWATKSWPVEYYFELVKKLPFPCVILGTMKDGLSLKLIELLKTNSIYYISAVGKLNLKEAAQCLARSKGYIGNDTGLSHLAEAVGTKTYVIWGPTVPTTGFEPSLAESRSFGVPLWCRPCGKTGRFCHRIFNHRYACLKNLMPETVLNQIIPELASKNVTPKTTKRLQFYRFLARKLTSDMVFNINEQKTPCNPKKSKIRIWFHAASQGELECLWSLIFLSLQRRDEVVITAFSVSALGNLQKLKQEICNKGYQDQLIFIGQSPREGFWSKDLSFLNPDIFVTVKYEAWPELWASLSEQQVLLAVLNAKPRFSLTLAKLITQCLGVPLPKMFFFTTADYQNCLLKHFPKSRCFTVGDARWERIITRSQNIHPRVQELCEIFSLLPRPWGVFAQVWEKDLKKIKSFFTAPVFVGTLWIVPHKTDETNLNIIKNILMKWGYEIYFSSQCVGK
ncbi:MAG: hypothetical protein HY843_07215, partial [Bdellovibrio sp.]|nr:hypothetical protein [Bdellovibrio sp.]